MMTAKEYIEGVAETNNYTVNTNNVDRMAANFTKMKEMTGDYYCPCQTAKTKETICPCVYMRDYNACRCGLYKKKEVDKT